jgi:3-oxoacyl-[acyl-carrier protein] reductase
MELNNKTVLVIGASGGIGSSIASILREVGAQVICHAHDRQLSAETNGLVLTADLRDANQIAGIFQTIKEKQLKLDGLVYTPAIEVPMEDPLDTSLWEDTFQVNLFAAVECARLAKPLMNQHSSMVFIGSIAAESQVGFALGSLPYALTKAAIHHLVTQLSSAWAPDIRVNSVVPGYTMTSMWDGFSDEGKKECKEAMAIKRFIQPEEIAHSVVYLLENEAVTGQRLVVDGGLGIKELV